MQALIALGGNLNNLGASPRETILAALHSLQDIGFIVEKCSKLYRTPAFPAGSGPDYVNAAAQLMVNDASLPDAVFAPMAALELAHGRTRAQRWGGRTLDIDLLALGDLVWPDLPSYQHWAGLDPALQATTAPRNLILPHPRLHERAFVLVPLMDIAPSWRHPVLDKTVRQMHAALPAADIASVIALAP